MGRRERDDPGRRSPQACTVVASSAIRASVAERHIRERRLGRRGAKQSSAPCEAIDGLDSEQRPCRPVLLCHGLPIVCEAAVLHRTDILAHLTSSDPSSLFAQADAVRKVEHGDGVLLSGLLAFSSYCTSNCLYCGLRSSNRELPRFRMSRSEIVRAALEAWRAGLGSVVLQAGEDSKIGPEAIAGIIAELRAQSDIGIALSIGEFHPGAYALWRAAGADRYFLRFETSNSALYEWLRPGRSLQDRLRCLKLLADLGYQTGSGSLVGLPRQTLGDLADDLLLMAGLPLDMVGIGPFVPHPQTPLGSLETAQQAGRNEHTPARACDLFDLSLRCIAIARLLLPKAHIPAATALSALREGGRSRALQTGANVMMQDVTPSAHKRLYEIYPNRLCREEASRDQHAWVHDQGRFIQSGRGDAIR